MLIHDPLGLRLAGALLGMLVSLPLQAASVSAFRKDIRALMAQERIPGLAIAVSRDGKQLWSEGFGYANLELKAPVTPRTKFRIASISKPLTAACVLRLYEAGRIDLDAPVSRYVPGFPDKGRPITARQLLSHRSGIGHYDDEDMVNRVHYPSMMAALAKFQDRPLLSPPDARYLYSSFGYNLIGAAVEGVTGKLFTTYMHECVFAPLGMKDTVPDVYAEIIAGRTAFYERGTDGELRNAPAVDNSDLWPAGGYLSTAEDLVRFADAVVNGGFLNPATRELMLTPGQGNRAEGKSYALGWSSETAGGRAVVSHTGSHFGAETRLDVYRDAHLSVAILANLSPEEESDVSERFEALSGRIARCYVEHAGCGG